MGREARPAPGRLLLVLWNRCGQRSFFGPCGSLLKFPPVPVEIQEESGVTRLLPQTTLTWSINVNYLILIQKFHRDVSSRCHVFSAWEGSGCFLCTDGESVPRLFAAFAKTLGPNSNKQRVSKREGISSKFAVAGTSQAKHVNWKQLRPLV